MPLRALLPIGFLVALLALFAVGLTRDPQKLPSALIDKPLPDFEAPVLGEPGTTVRRDELLGEPLLLNVFGSWCAACEAEHPLLIEIAETQPVKVVGINWRDTEEAATQWLEDLGNPYDVIAVVPEGGLILDLGVTGAPETFLVDRQGRIRYKYVGFLTDEIWEERLKPILDEMERTS